MAITDKRSAPPRWQCQDCKEIFVGSEVPPEVANIDDVHDVFSKQRGKAENRCRKCGGKLTLLAPAAKP